MIVECESALLAEGAELAIVELLRNWEVAVPAEDCFRDAAINSCKIIKTTTVQRPKHFATALSSRTCSRIPCEPQFEVCTEKEYANPGCLCTNLLHHPF